VLKGALTAGSLVVFLLYLGKLYKPMRDLSKMTDSVSKALIFTVKSLRRQLSFVLQETVLFRATLWQNIAYGKPEVSVDSTR